MRKKAQIVSETSCPKQLHAKTLTCKQEASICKQKVASEINSRDRSFEKNLMSSIGRALKGVACTASFNKDAGEIDSKILRNRNQCGGGQSLGSTIMFSG